MRDRTVPLSMAVPEKKIPPPRPIASGDLVSKVYGAARSGSGAHHVSLSMTPLAKVSFGVVLRMTWPWRAAGSMGRPTWRQSSTLHGLVSFSSGHVSLNIGARWIARVLRALPPPQLRSHSPYLPHGVTLHVHGRSLHGCVFSSAGHAAPPCLGICVMKRRLAEVPLPHAGSQDDQLPHAETRQSRMRGHGQDELTACLVLPPPEMRMLDMNALAGVVPALCATPT